MGNYGQEPSMVVNVVMKAVHDVTPCERYLINVSLEMKIAKLLPQWVLDVATLNIMKDKKKMKRKMMKNEISAGCRIFADCQLIARSRSRSISCLLRSRSFDD